tara:strand:+ start:295 stop:600 length:306 start_codon:yes stop_codon:yes gene_type:complete
MTNRREIDIIKEGYCDIRDEFFNFYNEYIKKYPERINAKDPRVSILANPIQLITVQRTNFELLDKSILREEFWKLNSDKVLNTKFNVKHHQLFFKFSFFCL